MLGWAAVSTQAPAIAPTVRPVSRIAVGDLEKKQAWNVPLSDEQKRQLPA